MAKWIKYWEYAGERALKTFAQTAIATIGVGAAGIIDVEWLNVISVASLGTVMSLLTSVLRYNVTGDE